jgi:hypothetical protein
MSDGTDGISYTTSNAGWRGALGVTFIPATALALVLPFVPESRMSSFFVPRICLHQCTSLTAPLSLSLFLLAKIRANVQLDSYTKRAKSKSPATSCAAYTAVRSIQTAASPSPQAPRLNLTRCKLPSRGTRNTGRTSGPRCGIRKRRDIGVLWPSPRRAGGVSCLSLRHLLALRLGGGQGCVGYCTDRAAESGVAPLDTLATECLMSQRLPACLSSWTPSTPSSE